MAGSAYIVAATIGAALGFLKMTSDNQSKISDYRLKWIESVRQSVSRFNASIHTILGRIAKEEDPADMEKLRSELRPNWYDFRESHNLVRLHFNNPKHHEEFLRFMKWEDRNIIDNLHMKFINIPSSDNDNLKCPEEICVSTEASLLLVILAIQRLVEKDKYIQISHEKGLIEKGLETIDLITSKILKETWETVKSGERKFRWAYLVTFCIFIIMVVVSLNHFDFFKNTKNLVIHIL
jgi:DNA modification methylase